MKNTGGLDYEEANKAAWEGGRGAVVGATKVSISYSYLRFACIYTMGFTSGSFNKQIN